MREEKKAITTYKSVFISDDGKTFDSAEECRKYEGGSQFAVLSALNRHLVCTIDEYSLFDGWGGNEEYNLNYYNVSDRTALEDINRALSFTYNKSQIPSSKIGSIVCIGRGNYEHELRDLNYIDCLNMDNIDRFFNKMRDDAIKMIKEKIREHEEEKKS